MSDWSGQEERFRELWESVRTERPVEYGLFTFGESVLPYWIVCAAPKRGEKVTVARGEVRITRPMIVTPYNAPPELENFSDNADEEAFAQFLLARTAAFSHLRLANSSGPARLVSDSVQEIVDRLNRQLDAEEEDQVAVLTASAGAAGVAALRYATERVMQSAPSNIQELRERGFLP